MLYARCNCSILTFAQPQTPRLSRCLATTTSSLSPWPCVICQMQLFHFHDCPTPNASPEQVPGYYDIITEPMDLGTVMAKLSRSLSGVGNGYSDLGEFVTDMKKVRDLVIKCRQAGSLCGNALFSFVCRGCASAACESYRVSCQECGTVACGVTRGHICLTRGHICLRRAE